MYDKIYDYRKKYEKIIIIILLVIVVGLSTIILNFVEFLPLKSGLIIITTILVFLAFLLADDIIDIKKLISQPHVRVYKDQNEANEDLKEYIENIKPKNVFMVEYSSCAIQDLLSVLIKTQILPNIYLLIQHPKEGEVIEGQKERIWRQITTVIYQLEEFRNYPNLKILCYKQRTSFRGRNFDDKLINAGWYIYKYDTDGKQYIYGHNQPVITFREKYEGFSEIKNMFNDTFKNLWENGISLSEVSKELKNDFLCSDTNFIKWCEQVSPKREERGLEIKR